VANTNVACLCIFIARIKLPRRRCGIPATRELLAAPFRAARAAKNLDRIKRMSGDRRLHGLDDVTDPVGEKLVA